MSKTPEELQNLKQQWVNDPCWDIEKIEGFEEYYDELLQFRLEKEKQWKQEYENRIYSRANILNCSYELAAYIIRLEQRIEIVESVLLKQ